MAIWPPSFVPGKSRFGLPMVTGGRPRRLSRNPSISSRWSRMARRARGASRRADGVDDAVVGRHRGRPLLAALGRRAPARRPVQRRDPADDLDEQHDARVAGETGHHIVQLPLLDPLGGPPVGGRQPRPEVVELGVGGPGGGQIDGHLLDDAPGAQDLLELHPVVGEVDEGGAGDGGGVRRGHDQAAAGALAHPGHAQVLHDAHRLAQHGPADAVALHELGLGTQHLPDRPTIGDDVGPDDGGHLLGALHLVAARHDGRGRHGHAGGPVPPRTGEAQPVIPTARYLPFPEAGAMVRASPSGHRRVQVRLVPQGGVRTSSEWTRDRSEAGRCRCEYTPLKTNFRSVGAVSWAGAERGRFRPGAVRGSLWCGPASSGRAAAACTASRSAAAAARPRSRSCAGT